jgi:hypothetical protein
VRYYFHALQNPGLINAIVKHSKISDLKSKNESCSQDDWEDILLSVFRGTTPAKEDLVQGVETIAKVERKAVSLTIIIQKRIEGITVWYWIHDGYSQEH